MKKENLLLYSGIKLSVIALSVIELVALLLFVIFSSNKAVIIYLTLSSMIKIAALLTSEILLIRKKKDGEKEKLKINLNLNNNK